MQDKKKRLLIFSAILAFLGLVFIDDWSNLIFFLLFIAVVTFVIIKYAIPRAPSPRKSSPPKPRSLHNIDAEDEDYEDYEDCGDYETDFDSAYFEIPRLQKYSTRVSDSRRRAQLNSIYDAFLDTDPHEECTNRSEIKVPPRLGKTPVFLPAFYNPPENNCFVAYYKNGGLYDVYPHDDRGDDLWEYRDIVNWARYLISDDIQIDFENDNHIINMPIPKFRKDHWSFLSLDYILYKRAKWEDRPELAVPLTYKAVSLMFASQYSYSKKDYYRLVSHLWEIGELYYADYLLSELTKRLPFMTDDKWDRDRAFDQNAKLGKELGDDYIQCGHSGIICEKCAPFQDRFYSLSGKDKRFPKVPSFILENKGLHCPVAVFFTFMHDDTITKYTRTSYDDCETTEVDAVKYSNRPFVDDRSIYDKQHYENYVIEAKKKKAAEDRYFSRDYWVSAYYDRFEYQRIVDKLGDKAPKSFSGYRRMKNSNSKNYQKIVELMKD